MERVFQTNEIYRYILACSTFSDVGMEKGIRAYLVRQTNCLRVCWAYVDDFKRQFIIIILIYLCVDVSPHHRSAYSYKMLGSALTHN